MMFHKFPRKKSGLQHVSVPNPDAIVSNEICKETTTVRSIHKPGLRSEPHDQISFSPHITQTLLEQRSIGETPDCEQQFLPCSADPAKFVL